VCRCHRDTHSSAFSDRLPGETACHACSISFRRWVVHLENPTTTLRQLGASVRGPTVAESRRSWICGFRLPVGASTNPVGSAMDRVHGSGSRARILVVSADAGGRRVKLSRWLSSSSRSSATGGGGAGRGEGKKKKKKTKKGGGGVGFFVFWVFVMFLWFVCFS